MRYYNNAMKRREPTHQPARGQLKALCAALKSLRAEEEFATFLLDLCTPAELEALADRWAVVPHLLKGESYREIHDLTGVSVTTVGRIARSLSMGAGGYALAAKRLGLRDQRNEGEQ
jgi:TrpR-related protein YerC/YecD